MVKGESSSEIDNRENVNTSDSEDDDHDDDDDDNSNNNNNNENQPQQMYCNTSYVNISNSGDDNNRCGGYNNCDNDDDNSNNNNNNNNENQPQQMYCNTSYVSISNSGDDNNSCDETRSKEQLKATSGSVTDAYVDNGPNKRVEILHSQNDGTETETGSYSSDLTLPSSPKKLTTQPYPQFSEQRHDLSVLTKRIIQGILRADMSVEDFSSRKSGFYFIDFYFVLSADVISSIKDIYRSSHSNETSKGKYVFSEIESALPDGYISSITLLRLPNSRYVQMTQKSECFFGYTNYSLVIKMGDSSVPEGDHLSTEAALVFYRPNLKYVMFEGLSLDALTALKKYLFEDFNKLDVAIPVWCSKHAQRKRFVVCYIDRNDTTSGNPSSGKGTAITLVDLLKESFRAVPLRRIDEKDLVKVFVRDGLSGFASPVDENKAMIMEKCPSGNNCPLVYNREHMTAYSHDHIVTPCPNIMSCADVSASPSHVERYVHFCKNGAFCPELTNKDHTRHFIHLHGKESARCCECTGLNNSKTGNHFVECHGCVLPVCSKENCDEKSNPEHNSHYVHFQDAVPFTSYGNNFKEQNSYPHLLEGWVREYFSLGDTDPDSIGSIAEISSWFLSLRPVHNCSAKNFLLILSTWSVLSSGSMKNFLKNPDLLVEHAFARKNGRDFLSKCCSGCSETRYATAKGVALTFAREFLRCVNDNCKRAVGKKEALGCLSQTDIEDIRIIVSETFSAIIRANENSVGINSSLDTRTTMDNFVFASLGPNMTGYGSSEVSIVFKPQVMYHPSFFVSIVSTILYATRSSTNFGNTYTHTHTIQHVTSIFLCHHCCLLFVVCVAEKLGIYRPWAKETEDARKYIFRPGFSREWARACAMDFAARVAVRDPAMKSDPKAAFAKVSLRDVQGLIKSREQSFMAEAHLPGVVSLDLIEHVYVAKCAASSLLSHVPPELKDKVHVVCDTRSAVFDWMARKEEVTTSIISSGYAFRALPMAPLMISMDTGNRDESTHTKISFTVRCDKEGATDFAVSLLADSVSVTFLCRPFDDAVYVYNEPLDRLLGLYPDLPPPLHVNRWFCRNAWGPVMHCMLVDDGDSVCLKHFGLSMMTNKESVKVHSADLNVPQLGNFSCLVFASLVYPTSFMNIKIKTKNKLKNV